MAPIDLMFIAAIVAAFLVSVSSIYAQKKWRLYTLFIGKKYDKLVHALITIFVSLEVIITGGFVYVSEWRFSSLWFFGIPIMIFAGRLFYTAIQEIGFGSLINANFFRTRRTRKLGAVYARYKHPTYISFVLWTVGLGFTLGRYGYFAGAGVLIVCLSLLAYIEKPIKDA